jgi:uncharacterized protein (TIGR00251 family)
VKVSLKISPRASRNQIKYLEDGTYKVFLTAAPVGGKANDSLIDLLAEYFDVAKSKIKIVRGLTNKNKIVEIEK